EEWIVRQLEALRAVRLQPEQRQVAVYGALRQPGLLRQAATRPVCLAARLSPQRCIDQLDLPPRYRRVFLLHVTENMSYRAISRCLDVSTKAVERDIAMVLELCQSRLRT